MESSSLDFVAQSCMDLTEAMNAASNEAERDSLITNHIKKVSLSVGPIEDFKKSTTDSSEEFFFIELCVLFGCSPCNLEPKTLIFRSGVGECIGANFIVEPLYG